MFQNIPIHRGCIVLLVVVSFALTSYAYYCTLPLFPYGMILVDCSSCLLAVCGDYDGGVEADDQCVISTCSKECVAEARSGSTEVEGVKVLGPGIWDVQVCPVKKGITELRVGAVRRLGIHVEESGMKGLLKLVANLLSLIHKNKLTLTSIHSLLQAGRLIK